MNCATGSCGASGEAAGVAEAEGNGGAEGEGEGGAEEAEGEGKTEGDTASLTISARDSVRL